VLDIGGGWSVFVMFAAQHDGVERVEDLWDSIAADAESVAVPASHRREHER
jgi:hypothetical protein